MDPITKKILIIKSIIQAVVYIVIGIGITVGTLFFSKSFGVKGWIDSLVFAGILLFTFAWMIVITNANFFTTLVYGVRQFISGLLGRPMEKDIIEYKASRKVYGKEIILVPFLVGCLFILAAIILWIFFF